MEVVGYFKKKITWQSLVALAILGFQIDLCENGDFHKKKSGQNARVHF